MSENKEHTVEIEKEEMEERAAFLSAGSLKRSDIAAMLEELPGIVEKLRGQIPKVLDGSDYEEAQKLLRDIAKEINGGKIQAFVWKNSWFGDPNERAKYMANPDTAQSPEHRKLLYEIYKYVTDNNSLIKQIAAFLDEFSFPDFKEVFCIIRSHRVLKDLVTEEGLRECIFAFGAFDDIYKEYNTDSIYDEVPVNSVKMSPEENITIVKEYMSSDMEKNSYLRKFFSYPGSLSSEGRNIIQLFDSKTYLLSGYQDSVKTLEARLNTISDLTSRIDYSEIPELRAYANSLFFALDACKEAILAAINLVDDYTNKKQTIPYAIMHYDHEVEDIVRKYSLGDLSDPFQYGTSYCQFFNNMARRLGALAEFVGKNANPHYGSKKHPRE